MTVQIRFRRGTTLQWETNNPTLAIGEPGYDTTLARFKIGNGVDSWDELAWQSVDADQFDQQVADVEAAAAAALAAAESISLPLDASDPAQIINVPTGGGGGTADSVAWADITGKPLTFTPAAHTHAVANITGLAPVATSGNYTDLSNRPVIPTTYTQVGAASAAQGAKADTAVQPGALAPVATSGLYSSLTGQRDLMQVEWNSALGSWPARPNARAVHYVGGSSALAPADAVANIDLWFRDA